MKNIITAKDDTMRKEKIQAWNNCAPNDKQRIRVCFLQALQSPVERVRHTAAQILAAYGAVDVPTGSWPDLVPQLVQSVTQQTVVDGIKIAALEVSFLSLLVLL